MQLRGTMKREWTQRDALNLKVADEIQAKAGVGPKHVDPEQPVDQRLLDQIEAHRLPELEQDTTGRGGTTPLEGTKAIPGGAYWQGRTADLLKDGIAAFSSATKTFRDAHQLSWISRTSDRLQRLVAEINANPSPDAADALAAATTILPFALTILASAAEQLIRGPRADTRISLKEIESTVAAFERGSYLEKSFIASAARNFLADPDVKRDLLPGAAVALEKIVQEGDKIPEGIRAFADRFAAVAMLVADPATVTTRTLRELADKLSELPADEAPLVRALLLQTLFDGAKPRGALTGALAAQLFAVLYDPASSTDRVQDLVDIADAFTSKRSDGGKGITTTEAEILTSQVALLSDDERKSAGSLLLRKLFRGDVPRVPMEEGVAEQLYRAFIKD